jgi:hypothetical protein
VPFFGGDKLGEVLAVGGRHYNICGRNPRISYLSRENDVDVQRGCIGGWQAALTSVCPQLGGQLEVF